MPHLQHIPFSSEQKPACPAVGVTNVACQSTFCSISNMCNLPNDERIFQMMNGKNSMYAELSCSQSIKIQSVKQTVHAHVAVS